MRSHPNQKRLVALKFLDGVRALDGVPVQVRFLNVNPIRVDLPANSNGMSYRLTYGAGFKCSELYRMIFRAIAVGENIRRLMCNVNPNAGFLGPGMNLPGCKNSEDDDA